MITRIDTHLRMIIIYHKRVTVRKSRINTYYSVLTVYIGIKRIARRLQCRYIHTRRYYILIRFFDSIVWQAIAAHFRIQRKAKTQLHVSKQIARLPRALRRFVEDDNDGNYRRSRTCENNTRSERPAPYVHKTHSRLEGSTRITNITKYITLLFSVYCVSAVSWVRVRVIIIGQRRRRRKHTHTHTRHQNECFLFVCKTHTSRVVHFKYAHGD